MVREPILYPLFLQVFLTLGVLLALGVRRQRSMRESGLGLDDSDLALGRASWSEAATKAANNFRNQFELPVLFYLAVMVALVTRTADGLMIALAWLFALSRLVHAAIHLGPNILRWRGTAYLIGFAALALMWISLAVRALTGIGG